MATNNDDILFDDFALISLTVNSDSSTTLPIMYGDCDNRFETETVETFRPDDTTFLVAPSIDGYN